MINDKKHKGIYEVIRNRKCNVKHRIIENRKAMFYEFGKKVYAKNKGATENRANYLWKTIQATKQSHKTIK